MPNTPARYLYVPLLMASAMLTPQVVAEPQNDCTVIRVAIEMEYSMANSFTGTTLPEKLARAEFYLQQLMQGVDEVYRREIGVGFELVHTYVHNRPEQDYDRTYIDLAIGAPVYYTRVEFRNRFRDWWKENMTSVDRDIALLVSDLDENGLKGGLAHLNGLCDEDKAYAINLSMNGSFPYPLVDAHADNEDIMRVLHEVGHILGAKHTHELENPPNICVTLDNNGELVKDGNGDVICSKPSVPTSIMSYCHLCDGGQTNRQMYFCDQNIYLMLGHINESTCLQSVPSVLTPERDYAQTFKNTGVFIDVLQNDHSTCSALHIVGVYDSQQGGDVSISEGTDYFHGDELYYNPPLNFVGTDVCHYSVADNNGNQTWVEVRINVLPQTGGEPDYLVVEAYDNSILRFHAITHEPLGDLVMGNGSVLVNPRAIAVLPNGVVLVGETGGSKNGNSATPSVLSFDGHYGFYEGVFYADERLEKPEAIHIDTEYVWILDGADGEIFRCDHTGENGGLFVQSPGDYVANDMTLDSAGDKIWVSLTTSNFSTNELRAFDTLTGGPLDVIDMAPYDVVVPGALFVRADGILEVGDRIPGNIIGFYSSSGTFFSNLVTAESTSTFGVGAALEFCEGPTISATNSTHAMAATGGVFAHADANGQIQDVIVDTWIDNIYKPWAIAYRSTGQPDGIPGDINDDGRVDGADLAGLLGSWGSYDATADFNDDGTVDGIDLAILLGTWRP